jgi:transcriptional regulator with XRE-family HTH domain
VRGTKHAKSLPEKLRLLRARKGLYLTDAARQIGIGRDTLSDLERGVRQPTAPTLRKLSDAYEVSIDELLANGKREQKRDTLYAPLNTRQLDTLVTLTTTAYERSKNEFGYGSDIAAWLGEALTALEEAHGLLIDIEGE